MLQVTAMALRERVPEQLAGLLTASYPELRAAAVFTLGTLVQVTHALCRAQTTAMSLCFFQTMQLCRIHLVISFTPISLVWHHHESVMPCKQPPKCHPP